MNRQDQEHFGYITFHAQGSHGYPWWPECSCGWSHPVGYATEGAALFIAEGHMESTL